MPAPVNIVDKTKAMDAVPAASIAKVQEKVRFIRTMSPDYPLELGTGVQIQFHIPVSNVTGARAAYGEYLSSDPEEIKALREVVAKQPYLYVFEQP
jgi:hypothetical protein